MLPTIPCDKCHCQQALVEQFEDARCSYQRLCHACFVQSYPQAVTPDFTVKPSLVGWMMIRPEFDTPQEPPMYPPLEAAVDFVTKMASVEIEIQKLTINGKLSEELTFDQKTSALLDKCITYIDSQIPAVDM